MSSGIYEDDEQDCSITCHDSIYGYILYILLVIVPLLSCPSRSSIMIGSLHMCIYYDFVHRCVVNCVIVYLVAPFSVSTLYLYMYV